MATQHFSDRELACTCGCGALPSRAFQRALQELRDAYGHPMIVTSGARCPRRNWEIYGGSEGPKTLEEAARGPHVVVDVDGKPLADGYGRVGAVDVHVYGPRSLELIVCARGLGWHGVGTRQHGAQSKRLVHLDRMLADPYHARPAFWTYE